MLLIVVFTLVGFGTVAYLPSFWALPSAFLTSSAAAAAVGFINCTASIGGFVGPKIIGNLSQRTGSFNRGFIFMIACCDDRVMLVLLCPRERTALPAVSELVLTPNGISAGIARMMKSRIAVAAMALSAMATAACFAANAHMWDMENQ